MRGKGFTAGMIAGAIAGAAVGMLMDPISEKRKRLMKRRTGYAIKTIGSIVSDVFDR